MTAFSVPATAAFDSYASLVSALNDWLDRSDLDGVAGQMIALAEDEMIAGLSPLFAETSASVEIASGTGVLPADLAFLTRVVSDTRVLPQIGAQEGIAIEAGSVPLAYSIEAAGLRVWPACDVTLTILYQPTLDRLTEANPSSLLLDQFPSLYFYGAMVFAHGYVVDDARAQNFRALFDNMMVKAKAYFTRQRYAGPLVPRVAFVP